jgi:hypothetical protein
VKGKGVSMGWGDDMLVNDAGVFVKKGRKKGEMLGEDI